MENHRWQIYLGIGHATRTVYNGIRTSSADFIHSYKKKNLTVRTNTVVDRIILENNNSLNNKGREYKAIGVEVYDEANRQLKIIKARKEIILSAGYV
jgi:choline dehydrogenase-like flavoprotein